MAAVNDDGPAFERRNHILLRRHGDDDGNIKRAPESDALSHPLAQQAAPEEPEPGRDQQHHGDAHAADIGLDPQGDAQPITQKAAQQSADRKQRNAGYRHAEALPVSECSC